MRRRSLMFVSFVVVSLCALTINAQLTTTFYQSSCPNVSTIVRGFVQRAIITETRVAASLLRLHFHDCIVNGCDASNLLDDNATFTGEKTAGPNNNSLRGFEVIDAAKAALENACSQTVSCADILAIAARDSVFLNGGPFWKVLLGRRDSTTANQTAANVGIPAPFDSVTTIIKKFTDVGLAATDVVPLSGGHTIGRARCTTFNNRLFDFNNSGSPDSTIEPTFLSDLQTLCPATGDNNTLASFDRKSKDWFDNNYFKELQNNSGLLQSDQELYADARTKSAVDTYINSQITFFQDFVTSMIRMGNISPLTGTDGQIRTNCRVVN
jgi:peroxidase